MPPYITAVTTILQLIISGATVITLVYTLTRFLKAPEQTQNDRLTACEADIRTIKDRLRDGDNHFASLDDGTTVTQQCILAMMDAQISGDNIEELKEKRNKIEEYLKQRGQDESSYLFVREGIKQKVVDSPLRAETLELALRKITSRVSGMPTCTPHVLRHTFATDGLRKGLDAQELQNIMGHSSINTTMIYAKVNNTDVANSYHKRF